MSTLLELAMSKYNSELYDWGGPKEGPGPYDGTIDIDNNGRLDIDCSHLVNNVLKTAGYDIPYLPTNRLNSDEALKYFDLISLQEATPNDLILYPYHVGIFSKYDSTTGTGEYFGSQSKGPGTAKFDEKGTWGWKMNFKVLRPKDQFKSKQIAQKKKNNPPALAVPKPRTNKKNLSKKSDSGLKHPHAAETNMWHQKDYYTKKVWNIASRLYSLARHNWD